MNYKLPSLSESMLIDRAKALMNHRGQILTTSTSAHTIANPDANIQHNRAPQIDINEWYKRLAKSVMSNGFIDENGSDVLGWVQIGGNGKKSKVKFKRNNGGRKMSAKFIKFADKLFNLDYVQYFKLGDDSDPSRKVEIALIDTEGDEVEEYYNTLDEAKIRFDAILTEIKG